MNAPRNETLFERARRLELQRSQDRLAELDRMKGRLALLEPLLEPLAAAGLLILPSEIEDTEEGALRPMPPLLGTRLTARVIRILKANGFTEVSRRPAYGHGPFQNVVLANGQLHLLFTVDGTATAPSPAPAAQPAHA